MTITAVVIDSREPEWAKNLKFNGAAVAVETMLTGDAMLYLDDGNALLVERKQSDDFLSSLKDGRLFAQAARLVEGRLSEQISGQPITTWPYIIITGTLRPSGKDLVITNRGETLWHWESVNSAFLTLQEMGVFVCFARDDTDYERALLALGNHGRGDVKVMPARSFELVSQQAAFLMGLPGVGEKTASQILEWAGGSLAVALTGITDTQVVKPNNSPIGKATQAGIRRFLSVPENMTIELKEV